MSNVLLSSAVSIRRSLIQQVQSIPEELFDVIPEPFNNSIRWNIGHIILTHNYFLSLGQPNKSSLPENYIQLFKPGSKPSDWIEVPPTKDELVKELSNQLSNLSGIASSTFDKHLDTPVEIGPLKLSTFDEVFNFATIHEATHLTTISCLLKVLQYQKSK
ncbi:DinB family protein [Heyndrickxia oleronia]|nr:DinB family protein [Heyndrickxia oleronia]MCM3236538.1 DinB family protein [Heyndrickxia oleronia]